MPESWWNHDSSVTNIHTKICIGCDPQQPPPTNPDGTTIDQTPAAKAVFDHVRDFQLKYGLTGNYFVFGEVLALPCDLSLPDPNWTVVRANIKGFQDSTLFANYAQNTVQRLWINPTGVGSCYPLPHDIMGYNPRVPK